jgi:hypothetical protein
VRLLVALALLIQGCGSALAPRVQERVVSGDGRAWTLPIPFQFDDSIPAWQKDAALKAMRAWNQKAGVTFIPRQDEVDYVEFEAGEDTCHSNVGMMRGRQEIVLSEGCLLPQVTHEIGHTIGLWHEQQRADRDLYVSVHLDRLADQKFSGNYDIVRKYKPSTPYDYDSVMHYGSYDFSSGDMVIERIGADPYIEPAGEITRWDAEKVRQLYGMAPL